MASIIGIDAHKATLTCSAVDELGREVDSITASNDGRGFAKIERFALRVGATRVGIECSGFYGLALARHLIGTGSDVKEVPGQLVKQIRRSLAKGKNDSLDALLIARVVVREKNLPPPPLKGVTHDLKALVDHRETARFKTLQVALCHVERPQRTTLEAGTSLTVPSPPAHFPGLARHLL